MKEKKSLSAIKTLTSVLQNIATISRLIKFKRFQLSRTVKSLQAKKLAYYCFKEAGRRHKTQGSETKVFITY